VSRTLTWTDNATADPRLGATVGLHARVAWVMVGGAFVWIVFAALVAPGLIHSGYNQTSFDAINAAFDFRHEHGVDFYLEKFGKLATLVLCGWLGFGGLVLAFDSRTFARRFVPPATPGTLGAIRCVVSLVLIYYVTAFDHLPTIARLPVEMRRSMGATDLFYQLPGFGAMVGSETALVVFTVLLTGLLVLSAAGLFTRVVVPLAAVGFLVFAGLNRSYTWYSHNGLAGLYVLAVLSFLPCGDGWSVDRWLRMRRGKSVPASNIATMRYGWARYVIWMAIAIPYVEAGASKLRNSGWDWWQGANLRAMMTADSLRPHTSTDNLTLALDTAPDWTFALFGLGGVSTELAMGLVLFSPRARRLLPIAMLGLHAGTFLCQGILFVDLVVLQSVFYDWRWLGRAIGRASNVIVAKEASSSSPWRLVQPVGAALLVVILAGVWIARLEWYPFSAWQMYSTPRTAQALRVVEYVKVFAIDESGAAWPAHLGRMMQFPRYWRVVSEGFEGAHKRATAEKFLVACGTYFNRAAPPGGRITQLRVENWRWDFVANPDDPRRGSSVGEIVVPVPDASDPVVAPLARK
jgi:hypothetical protein